MSLVALHRTVKHFVRPAGLGRAPRVTRALDGVSLSIEPGETLGLVGESGCGKSTLARLVLGLESPTQGEVHFRGRSIAALDRDARRAYRRDVQAVFQDPFASLSPRMRCEDIVAEPLRVQKAPPRAEVAQRVRDALLEVGLPADAARRYPHEFSGGQRQRIAIARALLTRPSLVVLDEPISALDVSIRAQILNLLADLKSRRNIAYLFIAHDLMAVASLADRIAVMYLGELVEVGSADDVALRPQHPYTRMLFAAVHHDPAAADAIAPRGEPPSAFAPPSGCRFHPRCPLADARCAAEVPALLEHAGRTVACHRLQEQRG